MAGDILMTTIPTASMREIMGPGFLVFFRRQIRKIDDEIEIYAGGAKASMMAIAGVADSEGYVAGAVATDIFVSGDDV